MVKRNELLLYLLYSPQKVKNGLSYRAVEYKNYPLVKQKSVVQKSEFKKNQFAGFQQINDG